MTNCFPFPHLISPSLPLSTLSVSLAGVANRPRPQFPLQLRLPPLGVFKLAHWWAKRKVFVVMQSRFDFDWDSFSDFLWRAGKGEEDEEIGGRWGEINTYLSLTGQLTRLAGDSHSTHSYKWIVPGTRCESVVRWGASTVLGGYLRGTFVAPSGGQLLNIQMLAIILATRHARLATRTACQIMKLENKRRKIFITKNYNVRCKRKVQGAG